MKTWLLVVLLGVASASQVRTQRAGNVQPTTSGRRSYPCSDPLYHARRGMPAAIELHREELIHLLHPSKLLDGEGKLEHGCELAAVEWPYLPKTYLVAYQTIVSAKKNPNGVYDSFRTLALALVRVSDDGTSFSVVAKTLKPLEFRSDLYLERFDLAPYRLNENETAFGLRTAVYEMYTGGEGRDGFLELLRAKDGRIEPILSTLMDSAFFPRGEEPVDPKTTTIHVLPTKTNGVFDLKKSVRSGGRAIFRWNGRAYETQDPEPVECYLNLKCDRINWLVARVNTSLEQCPNSLGASVFEQGASGARVLGAIPDGNRLAIDLSQSTAAYYWAEGNGFQGTLRGYVSRNCVQMDE